MIVGPCGSRTQAASEASGHGPRGLAGAGRPARGGAGAVASAPGAGSSGQAPPPRERGFKRREGGRRGSSGCEARRGGG